jgi:menaquinone-dependent protoporphyrinogen oxidase
MATTPEVVHMNVLVAYATKHGSTIGIAERIGSTLSAEGLDVTVQSVAESGPLAGYDAFVIGSAAYMGGWLGEATTFVRRNRSMLAERPVWLFSSGPVGADKVDKNGRDVLIASEPTEFAEFEAAIHPRAKRVFFGAYDPDAPPIGTAEGLMGRFLRLMPAVRTVLPAGDFRDWPEIERWAKEIAGQLQAVRVGVASR